MTVDIEAAKTSVSISALIGQTLQLRRSGRHHIALCPFHGERTPSFHVYEDGFHCYGCGAHGDVFDWLARAHGLSLTQAAEHLTGQGTRILPAIARPASATRQARDSASSMERARRIWTEAGDAKGTIVEAYLQHRGIGLPEAPVIRFHPRCTREIDGDPLPAMVALMADPVTGEPCGVHRTYLLPDGTGKAPIEKPKKMLGLAGVVRLAEPEGEGLGLAEGIETALSALLRIGWGPVWAAGSRNGIARFPILPSTSLTIFADADGPGMSAARECAARWGEADAEATICIPPTGEDWNDCARRLAA